VILIDDEKCFFLIFQTADREYVLLSFIPFDKTEVSEPESFTLRFFPTDIEESSENSCFTLSFSV